MTDIPAYRHDIVRDLAWVIGSPPLITTQPTDTQAGLDWLNAQDCDAALKICASHLEALDRDPTPLFHELQNQADRRLGHRFETLLSQWLQWDERYELLAQNLQVQHQGQTLGEFDFILFDRANEQYVQLEVACKFYLGVPDTTNPAHWFGPMLRDRLDLKLRHMRQQQSQLAQLPEAQAQLERRGWRIDQTRCLMKGRLFYPVDGAAHPTPNDVATEHPQGRWSRRTQFQQQIRFEAERWMVLTKHQWFSSHRFDPTMADHNPAVSPTLNPDQPIQRPVCLAGLMQQGTNWIESQRLFLVPDDWGPVTTNHESNHID